MITSTIMDVSNVSWRELKRFMQQKPRIVMSVIQPIVWLVLMGSMLEKVVNLPYFKGVGSYLDYMTPGIVVSTMLFGGVFGGLSVVWDRRLGFLNKMLAAPISRSAIPVGKMIAASFISALQAAIILALALAMGVNCVTGPLGLVAVIAIAMLLCLLLSGVSLALGAVIKTQETLMVVSNLLTMPLMYTSSALFPLEAMPSWLSDIARWNPLTHTIDPIRTIMIKGWEWSTIIPDVAIVSTLMIIVAIIATMLFRRSIS